MRNFYITFGQKYATEKHPTYPKAHPNGFVCIRAIDEREARKKAFAKFGQHWSMMYAPAQWIEIDVEQYFPMGLIEVIE